MIELKMKYQPEESEEYFYKSLIEIGHVKKINNEYYWTKEYIRTSIEAFIRLNRYIHSPYWRIYYKFSDFSKKKIRNFISAIHYAWKESIK